MVSVVSYELPSQRDAHKLWNMAMKWKSTTSCHIRWLWIWMSGKIKKTIRFIPATGCARSQWHEGIQTPKMLRDKWVWILTSHCVAKHNGRFVIITWCWVSIWNKKYLCAVKHVHWSTYAPSLSTDAEHPRADARRTGGQKERGSRSF